MKTNKIDKKKLSIDSHIAFKDAMAITSVCLDFFRQRKTDFACIIANKLIYGILVATACTNYTFNGVSILRKEGDVTFNVQLSNATLDMFEESGIEKIMQERIDNYMEVYSNIIKAIELQNIYNAMDLLAKTAFNGDKLEKDVINILTEMQQAGKERPEILKQGIADSLLKAKKEIDNGTKTNESNTKGANKTNKKKK